MWQGYEDDHLVLLVTGLDLILMVRSGHYLNTVRNQLQTLSKLLFQGSLVLLKDHLGLFVNKFGS
jgi:hypothetical protein